jgi:hypothetical protein
VGIERAICPHKRCGAVMEAIIERGGTVRFVCPPCERNRRGLCRDCPAKLPGSRFLRCRACGRARTLAADRARDRMRYPTRRKETLARHRERQRDPAWRAHRAAYMRAYRSRAPRDGFDRAYQRVYMATRRADPRYLARQNARRRELRAMKRQAVA